MIFHKICAFCNQPFTTTSATKKFCDRQHFKTCVICGKSFEIPNNRLSEKDASSTCSQECRSTLRKQTNLSKYGGVAPACNKDVQMKMQSTSLERFGVVHPAQSDEVKAKTIQTNLQRYGETHFAKTAQGRKQVSERFKDTDYVKTTVMHRKQTNILRYGFSCTLQSPEVRDKARHTYKIRTGYEFPAQNPEVALKSKETSLKHYGVDHPMKDAAIRNKSRDNWLTKYGDKNPEGAEEIKQRRISTMLSKYGVEYYLQSEDGKQKLTSSLLDKYGVEYFSQSKEWKVRMMSDPSKVSELLQFRENPKSYIVNTFKDVKPTLNDLCNKLGIRSTEVISSCVREANCEDLIQYVYSQMELEVYDAIHEICPDATIERNTHKVITPYELDLFLPEYKLGIECNPTSTHNSTTNTFDHDAQPISKNYHQMKSNLCKEKDVFLFHIFGYEWTHKHDIIISMLRNILGKNSRKIYARNTEIKIVNNDVATDFLQMNHRQGNTVSSVRLGLYFNDELVSLMTFGSLRHTIGPAFDDGCWELLRFCNKQDTSVLGGASKLFSHFIKNYNPVTVISFSDIAHTKGTMYEKLGFQDLGSSEPGYMWVDVHSDRAYNRLNTQKHKLKKFLNDDTIDLSLTEKQILKSHGFVQVYDSGVHTWKYTNTSLT